MERVTLSKRFSDEMSIIHFYEKNFASYVETVIPDDFRDNCILFAAKIVSLRRRYYSRYRCLKFPHCNTRILTTSHTDDLLPTEQ